MDPAKFVLAVCLAWISQHKVNALSEEKAFPSAGYSSVPESERLAPYVVAEFCSHVVCSKLPSSGYNRCVDEVSRNCWTPTDTLTNDNNDGQPLANECDRYDDCLALLGERRPASAELADPEQMVILDMENGAESDKRWGERLRPLKRWSERLTPYGKKWVAFGKPHSPKRWSERLKIPSRKWSERLKMPGGGFKRWSSRLILPQKKWSEDGHDTEDRFAMEQNKKWAERMLPTKREAQSTRQRRDAGDAGTDKESSAHDVIVGASFGKRSERVNNAKEKGADKRWADRILSYSKKWGSRIMPFEKRWSVRLLPLAKKWSGRILPIGTKKDIEQPFVDYDNNIGSRQSAGDEQDDGRAKRWSERMYPHVLETRQSPFSPGGTAINRALFRRAWPRLGLGARYLPLIWREQPFRMW